MLQRAPVSGGISLAVNEVRARAIPHTNVSFRSISTMPGLCRIKNLKLHPDKVLVVFL